MSKLPAPLVTVIIPNYNGRTHLERCLSSLAEERVRLHEPMEVLVVDNSSTDGTHSYLRREHPDVRMLALDSNQGYAGACDAGIRSTKSRYCLLLNNDAWFGSGALESLLQCAERGGFAFIGPTILNPDGSFQTGPRQLDFLGDPPLLGDRVDPDYPPFYMSGAALLVRRADYLDLGGFDGRFFILFEETDLQWRAHLRGKRIGYARDAQVYHRGGGTSAGAVLAAGLINATDWDRLYYGRRNNLCMLLKNYTALSLTWVLPLWLLSMVLECIGMVVTGHARQVGVYRAGLAWNLQHLRGTLRQRRIIQAGRTVSDRQVRSLFGPPFTRLRVLVHLARAGTHVEIQ